MSVPRSLRQEIESSIEAWWGPGYYIIPDHEYTLFVIKYGEHISDISVSDG